MVPSVIDYLLQLPEAMHFARVQELCGDGVFFYRMLSEYGNGTFQLIEFEDDLLLILIGDYTPKDTFEKITEISEDYMEISQFETDSSSFSIPHLSAIFNGSILFLFVTFCNRISQLTADPGVSYGTKMAALW